MVLDTDASDYGVGAWIGQKGLNDSINYLSSASRSLSKSERKYSATKKQLLAIVWALQKIRFYLIWRKFTLFTDIYFSQKELNSMMQNWLYTLMSHEF